MKLVKMAGVIALLSVVGCATTYEEGTLTNFVDRKTLEDVSDSDISAQNVDMEQMKKDRKLNVGVRVEVSNEAMENARIPNFEAIRSGSQSLAENYLSRVKAYRVGLLGMNVSEKQLMSGDDLDGEKYAFLIDMKITLGSETEQKYDFNETMYKASIDWKLIDNRTKKNGLGDAELPFIKEALTCKNVTMRKTSLSSVSSSRMGGSAQSNAQNAFRNVLENSLIEFRAQLANRLPFGGKVTSFRVRDDIMRFSLKAGPDEGVTKRMQMLVINEDGDPVAIGQVNGGKGKDSNIEVWRWMSKSLEKEMTAVAEKGKNAVEEWMDQEGNGLYAVCLGMPTPDKDERTHIHDYK